MFANITSEDFLNIEYCLSSILRIHSQKYSFLHKAVKIVKNDWFCGTFTQNPNSLIAILSLIKGWIVNTEREMDSYVITTDQTINSLAWNNINDRSLKKAKAVLQQSAASNQINLI